MRPGITPCAAKLVATDIGSLAQRFHFLIERADTLR